MSASVVGLIYRIKFGSMAAKSIAVKLADNSNDDGENIFPSKRTVAAAVECSKRTVDRYMDLFLVLGILQLDALGGGRRADTVRRGRLLRSGRASVYAWNMPLLHRLADGEITVEDLTAAAKEAGCLTESGDAHPDAVARIKGAAPAPFQTEYSDDAGDCERVQLVHPLQQSKGCNADTQRVQPCHAKGAGAAPEPSLNHHLTPTLSEREGQEPADIGSGFATGWTEAACTEIAALRSNPIAGHVATDFLDQVVGTHNPPRQADAAAYVRQLRHRLQPFDGAVLRELAGRMIETRGTTLPGTADIVATAISIKQRIEAEARRERIAGSYPSRARYVVRDGDLHWGAWIEHLRTSGQTDIVQRAYAARAITVTHRLPQPAAELIAIGEGHA